MTLEIFYCAQYFKSLAICSKSKVTDGCFPHELIRAVGGSEMITKMRGSGLKLFRFGNKFLPEGK
jgi:hypothetical protein